jgi:uncharacterized protein YebE (UPF0316 family)
MDFGFEFALTRQGLLIALLIFVLRVVYMSMDTLRFLFIMRGRKVSVWLLGFAEAAVFIVTIAYVLADTQNVFNLLAYAGGFATGNVVGMWMEERLAIGFAELRVISSWRGTAVGDQLREHDYAVTEIPARGKDGMVTMLTCSIRRKEIPEVEKLVREVDEDAFITTEDIVKVQRGFWGVRS